MLENPEEWRRTSVDLSNGFRRYDLSSHRLLLCSTRTSIGASELRERMLLISISQRILAPV